MVSRITPIRPILRPFLSMISDLLYKPSMVGSWAQSMLATSMLVLIVSRKGTTPSTPLSNSWLPRVWKSELLHKPFFIRVFWITYHGVGGQEIEHLLGDIPATQVVPQGALETVARIDVDGIQFGLLGEEATDRVDGAGIATDAGLAGIAGAARGVRGLEPKSKSKRGLVTEIRI